MRRLFFVFLSLHLLAPAQSSQDPKKEGYIQKKDETTHKLLYEGLFKNGQPVGRFKYYYPNDSVRAIVDFSTNGKTAYARLFHVNGKRMGEGRYMNKEVKDSVWTYYDEAGVLLSRETYKAGNKDGASFVYLPNGSVSEEKHYRAGALHGPFKEFFSGRAVKSSGAYVDGLLEGRVCYYFPNGVEVAAGYYKKGVKTGPWIYRVESGKVREKELYKNGQLATQKETDEFFQKNKVTESKAPVQAKPSNKKMPKSDPNRNDH